MQNRSRRLKATEFSGDMRIYLSRQIAPCIRPAALLLPWLALCIVGSIVAWPVAAQSLDARFLDGVRERQLFSLAEKFCRDRLARQDLPEARRAELSIELSRCLTEEALQSAPEKRDAIWQQAMKVVDQFAKQYPQNPRLVQVRVQRGLVQLTWGELLAQEAELAGDKPGRIAKAQDHLREAIEELRKAETKTAELLRRQQPGRKSDAAELSSVELRSLEKNIQYQLARALRSQGESYPADSADRINSLTQAVELFRNLAQGDTADPLTWPSRLDAAACYRLLGHLEAAARRLDLAEEDSPPARYEMRARAERIRLELAEDHLDQALGLAEKNRMWNGQPLADLDYAVLEAFLAAWRRAADANDAASSAAWQAKATAAVRDLDQRHGPYWRRRAESLFAEQVAANPATTDVAVLTRAAEGFYRAGQPDDALTAYDRAIKQARGSSQEAKAFELGYAAAAIEHQRQHYAAAADRFRQVALATPAQPKAAEAHLLAIYDLGKEARKTPSVIERYVEMLAEHLATWPKATTADRAHLWLARVHERDRAWQRALDDYQAVRPGSESAAEAAAGLARSYQALLAEQQSAGKSTSATALAAVAALEATSGIKKSAPPGWNAEQQQAVLAAAKILLEYTDNGFAKAEQLLSLAIEQAGEASDEWRASAEALLVFAIAAQGRTADAQRHAAALGHADPGALRSLVEGLGRLCESAQPALRTKLATLELQILEMIGEQSADANDEDRRSLALAHAHALGASGRKEEGIGELKKLAEANPREGRIQESLALALWDAGDPQALAAWQNVERKSRSGNERWLRAKLYEALIYERTGDRQHAAQAVNVVKNLYPEMGGTVLKQQFLDVLKRCE
jgi:hypothetical protein